jgi:hypothetical protein
MREAMMKKSINLCLLIDLFQKRISTSRPLTVSKESPKRIAIVKIAAREDSLIVAHANCATRRGHL